MWCGSPKPAAKIRWLPDEHKGKVIFIDAVNQVTRERAQSVLKPEHQQRILSAYRAFWQQMDALVEALDRLVD
jgi:type I restriction-modification system DNA methylase subunit